MATAPLESCIQKVTAATFRKVVATNFDPLSVITDPEFSSEFVATTFHKVAARYLRLQLV